MTADQTCANCRHALPVDPRWLRYAAALDQCNHCAAWRYPTASVMLSTKPCQFTPSRWEPKEEPRGRRGPGAGPD